MYRKPFAIFIIIVLLVLFGCSVQKNTGLSRAYHNLTAKYNVLFNGSESFKDGLEKIEKEYKDDYAAILPVFKYSGKDVVTLAGADMERTIKKCSKLITLHSITTKPKARENKTLSPSERAFFSKKEYNLFVDDAYLLMGKAHFYKHEFAIASDVFKKVINDFKNQPIVYEAQIWQAKVSIETAQYISASDILTSLVNNTEFPKKILPELYTTYADFYLRQKDYPKAIDYLVKALEIEKQKKIRTRYLFILAQLSEKTGNLKLASDYYTQVIKLNPAYDMAFNAHINRALAYEQGFGRVETIESELLKMLHDDKNLEYQDQIYYALGNLATKAGNQKKALEYYRKSIDANGSNERQKLRSYLTIADIFYGMPDYPNAQAYYDSAVTRIDPDYPGYNAIFTKSKSLTRLVQEINTVKFADSVLILASLPQSELNRRIDNVLADIRKKEEEARQKEYNAQLDQEYGQQVSNSVDRQSTSTTGSQWYFYNDAAKSQGYREFKLRWGNRRLEDHWQRASKITTGFIAGNADEEERVTEEVRASEPAYDKTSRAYYLADIPFTDSAKSAVYMQLEDALYNTAQIYHNELKDNNKASETFKELIQRFPSGRYLLSSYYTLYVIAKEQNNQAMMDFYKNIIVSRFPDSMYARVLNDPEYFREIENEDRQVREFYQQTYEIYKSGNYSEAAYRSENAMKTHPGHTLVPLFHYLSVLSRGKTADKNTFRDSLQMIMAKYPGSEIASDAQNLVNYMDMEHPELREAQEIKISKQLYQNDPDARHLFVFALNKKINANQLVFNIINYNLDHSDSLNLMVEIIGVGTDQNLIAVKTFVNQKQAKQYLLAIVVSEEIHKDFPEVTMIPFIISENNFQTLVGDKSVDRYLKFYNENYR